MFKIPVIHNCSYAPSSSGTLLMTHTVLRTLAGAVWDRKEWLALLLGTRSQNGLRVKVTGLRVPQQTRSHGACDTVDEEPLTPDIVGVVHSHHTMGAFFSNTDQKTLNTRFPLSIVIAQLKGKNSQTEQLFGFGYEATAKVILPCGNLGSIPFTLFPAPRPTWWPQTINTGFRVPQVIEKCELMTGTVTGLNTLYKAPCGLSTEKPTVGFFGQNSDDFIKEVESKTKTRKEYYTINPQLIPTGPPNLVQQIRDEHDLLTSWNWVD